MDSTWARSWSSASASRAASASDDLLDHRRGGVARLLGQLPPQGIRLQPPGGARDERDPRGDQQPDLGPDRHVHADPTRQSREKTKTPGGMAPGGLPGPLAVGTAVAPVTSFSRCYFFSGAAARGGGAEPLPSSLPSWPSSSWPSSRRRRERSRRAAVGGGLVFRARQRGHGRHQERDAENDGAGQLHWIFSFGTGGLVSSRRRYLQGMCPVAESRASEPAKLENLRAAGKTAGHGVGRFGPAPRSECGGLGWTALLAWLRQDADVLGPARLATDMMSTAEPSMTFLSPRSSRVSELPSVRAFFSSCSRLLEIDLAA